MLSMCSQSINANGVYLPLCVLTAVVVDVAVVDVLVVGTIVIGIDVICGACYQQNKSNISFSTQVSPRRVSHTHTQRI